MRVRLPFVKTILVSNRSPYVVIRDGPESKLVRSPGGVSGVLEQLGGLLDATWIAWDGSNDDCSDQRTFPVWPTEYRLKLLSLSPQEVEHYYYGLANQVLWPLCHELPDRCMYVTDHWSTYRRVNRKFAASAAEEVVGLVGQDLVWFHDYHLALAPESLRSICPNARIAFFWHIPFPSWDMMRRFAHWRELLRGLLGSDVIGFHCDRYVENFLESVERAEEGAVDRRHRIIQVAGRSVQVRAIPLGIDAEAIQQLAHSSQVRAMAREIRAQFHSTRLAVSVERLDYTKGVLERLDAIALFFRSWPEMRGRLSFLQIAAPTRVQIRDYRELQDATNRRIAAINREFAAPDWRPVTYLCEYVPFDRLVAYYLAADLAIVTPLSDGMNLVAKEYVAAKVGPPGSLVLSEFAGAAEELREGAILVDPHNVDEMALAIRQAVELSDREKRQRMRRLRDRVCSRDFSWWAGEMYSVIAGMAQSGVAASLVEET